MLRILGLGMPRTGTQSLSDALNILGIPCIHHDPARLNIWGERWEVEGVYDDVEAVTDFPAIVAWRQLVQAYPIDRYILTVRNTDSWWDSVRRHSDLIMLGRCHEHVQFTMAAHSVLFGSPMPSKALWCHRYETWGREIVAAIPSSQLLVMDITRGEGWEELCNFLGRAVPRDPFPHENKRR